MGKDKVKIHFDLQVKKINRLPDRLNGSTLFILWRRGSKKNSGQTKRALVKDGEATWGESISFVCSLFRESDSDRFDAKTIAFALKEVRYRPSLIPFHDFVNSYVTPFIF